MDVARRTVLANSALLSLCAVNETAAQSLPKGPNSLVSSLRPGSIDGRANSIAFQNLLEQLSSMDGDTELHRSIYIPAGRYRLENIALGTHRNNNRFSIIGDGIGNTILEFSHLDGDAISVTGSVISIADVSIASTPARKAQGKGNGIAARGNNRSTTQSRIDLTNVQITDQPGDGVYALSPELHCYRNVFSANNSGSGFHWVGETGGISNMMSQVRSMNNAKLGIHIEGKITNSTLLMPQCLDNLIAQLQIGGNGGRSITIIEPDIEAGALSKQGKSVIGLVMNGFGHRVLGGTFFGLAVGVKLQGAECCLVDMPLFSNASLPTEMDVAVLEDSRSSQNRLFLASSYHSVRQIHQIADKGPL